ncbi:alpha/beta fold hydrolase [Amycolatopsis decaplanina]|uniref:Alpha/beta hydrolase fold containing protein n=1 Tax=Amycolatopsis decaplanina DSM 44594 TaxID=1284240 RepID=M2YZ30_9PSEU|nr:alpha/beta hydrolase [Amycolatopsis decaplanina]EME60197.1 alpha/beta hydrolase fold containing protein [Amycolatopsis decaplanina DSM 44594]
MTNTPPVGGFQEIDGRRLFVHRSGDGGPAVVFLPGASAVGLDYFGVQQEVSRFTTAVVYDRGGTGYSDALPLPRGATAVATELRELLLALDIRAPYVLAAHSLGGLYAHRFAQLYPREVAGLVFLDALHPDWDDFMPPAASLAAAERPSPGPDRTALRAMYAELREDYPEDVLQALVEAKVSDEWLRAGAAERTGLVALATEVRAGPSLPDVPMVALTVVGTDPAHPSQELNEAKMKMEAARVSGFFRGEQRVLSDTLHHRLCFDRPDAVVQAIRDVVDGS